MVGVRRSSIPEGALTVRTRNLMSMWTLMVMIVSCAAVGRAGPADAGPMGFFNAGKDRRRAIVEQMQEARRVELTRRAFHGWSRVVIERPENPGKLTGLEEAGPLGFSRADVGARIRFPVRADRISVSGVLEPLGRGFSHEMAPNDEGILSVPFPAAVLPAGDYSLRVLVSDGEVAETADLPIIVGPYLHYDAYHAYHWNSGGSTQKALEGQMAINRLTNLDVLDTPYLPARDALREGLLLSAHEVTIHQSKVGGYAATGPLRERAARRGEAIGRMAARYNHIRYCLANSEYGSAGLRRYRNDAFSRGVQEDIGLTLDGLAFGKELAEKQVAPGIYPHDLPEVRAARWARAEGGGWFRLGRITAEGVRRFAPQVKIWLDPLRSVGQFRSMDAVSFWEYSTDPYNLLRRIKFAQCIARNHGGLDLYVTTSQWFLGIRTESGGGRVFRSPDQHRFYTWLIASQGTDMLGFWAMNQISEQPECARGVAEAMEQVAYPYGTLLKDTEDGDVPVAVYLSGIGSALGAADRPHLYWFRHHYLNGVMQPLVKKFDGRIARLDDGDILAGRHVKYPLLICPIFRATTDRLRDRLKRYQEEGGHIVGDELWRVAGLEPDEVIPAKGTDAYDLPYSNKSVPEWHRLNARAVADWQPAPDLDFAFTTSSDDVILSHRTAGPVHYYAAVNARFEKGEWSERFGVSDPRYRGVGVENSVGLSFQAARGAAIYEAVEGRRLGEEDYIRQGNRVEVQTSLPSAGARLYVVYPRPASDLALEVSPDSPIRPGTVMKLRVVLRDENGRPMPGEGAIDLELLDAEGTAHDVSGIFPLPNGQAQIPLGIDTGAPAGKWQLTGRHIGTGLESQATFQIKSR